MQWEGGEESTNVEDQRGGGPVGGRGMALGGGAVGLVVVVVGLIFGVDLRPLVNAGGGGGGGADAGQADDGTPHPAADESATEGRSRKLVGVVLKYTEDVWTDEFRRVGKPYPKPKLDLFRGEVRSGCGFADAQVGPFYCPADRKVYLDLGFFDTMRQQLGAKAGDFACAYVVAHEVGHHVQNLLGTSAPVDRARRTGRENDMSVRLELQADFLAGYALRKANDGHHFLQPGDLDDALDAANKIGDDTLQKRAGRRVTPDSFTHGSSRQRIKCFRDGFESGDLSRKDRLFDLSVPAGDL